MAFLLSLLIFLIPQKIHAIYDPLSVPNNKFGMHIADFNDIADVAALVNSGGGDWGYITLVASDNDRDSRRWQGYFDQMRRLHLIPIVRIATHVSGNRWTKPDPSRFEELVSFLNGLTWPTQNRYVVLFNEPNHANEWGGAIEPEAYAQMSIDLAKKLHGASEDFFVLPAGLDVSAASDGTSMDAAQFLKQAVQVQPEFLSVFDGWTSHSYPNPAFSGSPNSFGRGTLRSYDWELSFLSGLGLQKRLPVFITETGWMHREGMVSRNDLLSPDQVGQYLQQAVQGSWNDARIVAITPFVFNYQDIPFDHFSWKRLSRIGGYYAHVESYRSIQKVGGLPRQKEQYDLSDPLLPLALVAGSSYTLSAQIKNLGQGILSDTTYDLELADDGKGFVIVTDPIPTLEPGEKDTLTIHLQTPQKEGTYRVSLNLIHGNTTIPLQMQDIRLVAPPSLIVESPLGWRSQPEAYDVSVLVYEDKTLLHKYTGLTLKDSKVRVEGLSNILPGQPYRVVILVPYYLPGQTIQAIQAGETSVSTRRLLPLDYNQDGTFTTKDLIAMIRLKPNFILSLFAGK